jgi:hypothetical protein
VGEALREERLTIEPHQMLFHQPTHEVRDIHPVDAVAEAALETVASQERQKELEVLLLSRCAAWPSGAGNAG